MTLGLILFNSAASENPSYADADLPRLLRVARGLIIYGIFSHVSATPTLFVDTIRETRQGIQQLGFGAMAFILLRAYSLGAGTYTGIEAVSNGLQILRPAAGENGQKDDGLYGRLAVVHGRGPPDLLSSDQCSARRGQDL